MTISLEEIVRKYILINATEHEGQAQPKSVLGKILADHPDLRAQVLEIRSMIEENIENINAMGLKKQQKELEALGGYEEEKKVEKKELPGLDIKREGLVVRFAPNPDGALHLGNARPAVLCDEYAKKYKGKFILRFDDTDPKIKVPEKQFYRWIKEDLKWLKIKWHKEVTASRRLPIYYKHAEELLKLGGAYVCTCSSAKWKDLRDRCKACPCRDLDVKTQLRNWKKMLKAGFNEGEAVLRVKTDIEAKNPAVRDWAAFRIVDKPRHPLSKRHVWPLYNFASAIDDHLCRVTHIFRGQEHSTNDVKQAYVYQYFKWHYPFVVTLGRFSLSDMVLSKSRIREGIKKGIYDNWDDPRLGTLRALRRRGFQPQALRHIITEIGPKPSDITISMENLSAYNRRIIDSIANRHFFLQNPKKIEVHGLKLRKAKLPLHPDEDRGFRMLSLTKIFYIESDDFEKYRGLEIRLKDLCNIKLDTISKLTSIENKPLPKIHWLPAKYIEVRVILPGKEIKGFGETALFETEPGDIVQFERFGFVRIEKATKNNITAIFIHE